MKFPIFAPSSASAKKYIVNIRKYNKPLPKFVMSLYPSINLGFT